MNDRHAKPHEQDHAENSAAPGIESKRRVDALKSRLEPDHSKPIDKKKLVFSIIIFVLAIVLLVILQANGF